MTDMKPKQDSRLMTDQDVADMLHTHVKTLQRRLTRGPRDGEVDIGKAEHMRFAGSRLWLRASVESVLGIG